MDFSFSEEQTMLRDLAREILEAEVTLEVVKEVEAGGEFQHRGIWSKLAEANLLGLAIPEEYGGMGFGFLEVCVLLEEIGRVVAPIPTLPTLVLGVLPIARYGSEGQRARWLSAVAAGEAVLSGALVDAGSDDPAFPATTASRKDGCWRLTGVKQWVSAAEPAARILLPAAVDGGVKLFLLDPAAEGVALSRRVVTSREPLYELSLVGARVMDEDVLPLEADEGGRAVSWLYDCALVASCALQVGVSSRALEITADYVKERVQFKQPIGAFQAVQHRCADAYIDLAAMRWTLWRAAWKIADGHTAAREAMVAKFWAAEGGTRIASAAQHLHAGHGVDLDYTIHRYFIWTKALELYLGSATPQLARLGSDMARTGPEECR